MIKIEFKQEYTPKSEGARTYRSGEIVELSRASANHFVSRGVAEYLQAKEFSSAPEVKKTPLSASQPARVSRKKTAKKSDTSQQSGSTTSTESPPG